MFEFWKQNKVIIILVAFCVVVAGGFSVFNLIMKPSAQEASFGWDETGRDLDVLGVDSSGLRLAYRYSLSPNSYHPLYEKPECSVLSIYKNYEGEGSEKSASDTNLRSYSQNREASIRDETIRYNFGEKTVPVRFLSYETETDGLFHGVFSRVFGEEGKQLLVDVACDSKDALNAEFVNTLDAVVITDKASKV